jgi:hypothetical protein
MQARRIAQARRVACEEPARLAGRADAAIAYTQRPFVLEQLGGLPHLLIGIDFYGDNLCVRSEVAHPDRVAAFRADVKAGHRPRAKQATMI